MQEVKARIESTERQVNDQPCTVQEMDKLTSKLVNLENTQERLDNKIKEVDSMITKEKMKIHYMKDDVREI